MTIHYLVCVPILILVCCVYEIDSNSVSNPAMEGAAAAAPQLPGGPGQPVPKMFVPPNAYAAANALNNTFQQYAQPQGFMQPTDSSAAITSVLNLRTNSDPKEPGTDGPAKKKKKTGGAKVTQRTHNAHTMYTRTSPMNHVFTASSSTPAP